MDSGLLPCNKGLRVLSDTLCEALAGFMSNAKTPLTSYITFEASWCHSKCEEAQLLERLMATVWLSSRPQTKRLGVGLAKMPRNQLSQSPSVVNFCSVHLLPHVSVLRIHFALVHFAQ